MFLSERGYRHRPLGHVDIETLSPGRNCGTAWLGDMIKNPVSQGADPLCCLGKQQEGNEVFLPPPNTEAARISQPWVTQARN